MSIYAFIPARSGSTRLKNKNILFLNQRPLIYWSVKCAIIFKKISENFEFIFEKR
jgi:CMP-N,N'-diacetyllegionaminic acid synthase